MTTPKVVFDNILRWLLSTCFPVPLYSSIADTLRRWGLNTAHLQNYHVIEVIILILSLSKTPSRCTACSSFLSHAIVDGSPVSKITTFLAIDKREKFCLTRASFIRCCETNYLQRTITLSYIMCGLGMWQGLRRASLLLPVVSTGGVQCCFTGRWICQKGPRWLHWYGCCLQGWS